MYTFRFVGENDKAFFSTDINQKVSDDFVDIEFIKPHTKKWCLNKMGAVEIPNPDLKYQA